MGVRAAMLDPPAAADGTGFAPAKSGTRDDARLDLIGHEAWQAQRERIGQKLSRDYYWCVFEPFEPEKPDSIVGSISDDLADIWRDLRADLTEIDSGKATSITDAVWHWRFSFETHWAQHAAGAIVALTALCFGQFADINRPEEAAEGR